MDEEDVRRVAAIFPESIGLRLHSWGFYEILYSSYKGLEGDPSRRLPGSIGGLGVGMTGLMAEASSKNVPTGMQVAPPRTRSRIHWDVLM